MILLDTDHWSALKYRNSAETRLLQQRMEASRDQDFTVSAVTLEEQMRGWLAEIAATVDAARQVGADRRLVELVRFFSAWKITPFDEAAAASTALLRKARVRIGTMDLKIASIVLSRDMLLLTANSKDFAHVPGLRFENWLH